MYKKLNNKELIDKLIWLKKLSLREIREMLLLAENNIWKKKN